MGSASDLRILFLWGIVKGGFDPVLGYNKILEKGSCLEKVMAGEGRWHFRNLFVVQKGWAFPSLRSGRFSFTLRALRTAFCGAKDSASSPEANVEAEAGGDFSPPTKLEITN
jgi:hypothetical protein